MHWGRKEWGGIIKKSEINKLGSWEWGETKRRRVKKIDQIITLIDAREDYWSL